MKDDAFFKATNDFILSEFAKRICPPELEGDIPREITDVDCEFLNCCGIAAPEEKEWQ
jgi:hypothetical protein